MNEEVFVKEIGDRRFLSVRLLEGELPEYKKRILELGKPAGFLKTQFYMEMNQERILLDFTEYRPLSKALWENRDTTDVLFFLIQLCECIRQAEEMLFSSESIPISLNCIYVRKKPKDLLLAYLPNFVQEGTFQEHFLSLLEELSRFGLPKEWDDVGRVLTITIRSQNPGVRGILRMLTEQKRELEDQTLLGEVYEIQENGGEDFWGASFEKAEEAAVRKAESKWVNRLLAGAIWKKIKTIKF